MANKPENRAAAPERRRPGRPGGSDAGNIGRDQIIRIGLRLTKTVNLQDVSIVLVARTMNVTPALLHYYLKGRDHLTSGIMNLFYREVVRHIQKPTGSWEDDLLAGARAMYSRFIKYPGVASYCLVNNRFRTFQLTENNEVDFGVTALELFTELVMKSGCVPERAGLYSHLMRDFIMTSAHSAVSDRYPANHREFIERKTIELDPAKFPAILATVSSQVTVSAETAFLEGCRLFIMGLRQYAMTTKKKLYKAIGSVEQVEATSPHPKRLNAWPKRP